MTENSEQTRTALVGDVKVPIFENGKTEPYVCPQPGPACQVCDCPSEVRAVAEGTLPPLDVTDEDKATARKTGYIASEAMVCAMLACREHQLLALAAQLAAEREIAAEVDEATERYEKERDAALDRAEAAEAQLAAAQEKIREFQVVSYAQYQDQMAQKARADAAEAKER